MGPSLEGWGEARRPSGLGEGQVAELVEGGMGGSVRGENIGSWIGTGARGVKVIIEVGS